jgi:cysteine desulfurase/selenocysteine lyase
MEKSFSWDVEKIRKDFPILHQEINGHPLVYFDNAATSQKPKSVIDAIRHFYEYDNANVHRGLHTLSERATLQYEQAREAVKYFINAKNHHECIFVRGTTEAINLVASSYVQPRIRPGEEILVTEMEHHSNIVPWQLLSKHTGCNVRVVPINDDGELKLDEFEKLLTPDTQLLAITHISNAIGTINPLKEMIKIAHDHDVVVLVDGAQAAPLIQIDVQDLNCDFYAFSGHKMLGPTGIGVLYGKAETLDRMVPYQGGGEMITRVSWDITEYQLSPHRFEAGTPNIAGAIGLHAAIDYLNDLDKENIVAYESELLRYATKAMQSIKGIGPLGTAKNKASILTFVLQNVHAHDVGTILNSMGIAVRSGHHCAMPLMDRFQVAASTRASFSFYNTKQEIDFFVEELAKVEEVFGK